mmetsp:Transcript_7782/g.17197  ORF Transcript_7782/g.17197 Transcript_7782/m.17197 type:complete len:224 (+) Transcript_7782:231-902(+)
MPTARERRMTSASCAGMAASSPAATCALASTISAASLRWTWRSSASHRGTIRNRPTRTGGAPAVAGSLGSPSACMASLGRCAGRSPAMCGRRHLSCLSSCRIRSMTACGARCAKLARQCSRRWGARARIGRAAVARFCSQLETRSRPAQGWTLLLGKDIWKRRVKVKVGTCRVTPGKDGNERGDSRAFFLAKQENIAAADVVCSTRVRPRWLNRVNRPRARSP